MVGSGAVGRHGGTARFVSRQVSATAQQIAAAARTQADLAGNLEQTATSASTGRR